MNCLIIDDEVLAQDVVAHYIAKTPQLVLRGRCGNALEAFAALGREAIDLVFLDIQMPEMNGLSFLRSLKSPPKVILTTAYADYALDGYELDVVDYLLKPFSLERFMKAVQKATAPAPERPAPMPPTDLFVKCDGRHLRLLPADILYVEGMKNYLLIHTPQRRLVVHSTMKALEDQLAPQGCFIRVHKSFLVNRGHITELDGNLLRIGAAEVPVGSLYRDALLSSIGL